MPIEPVRPNRDSGTDIADPASPTPGSVYELVIGLDWGWDEGRGKLLDNRTGLDLLVDGKPNPAIPDAPTRPGYVRPSWKDANAEWVDDEQGDS